MIQHIHAQSHPNLQQNLPHLTSVVACDRHSPCSVAVTHRDLLVLVVQFLEGKQRVVQPAALIHLTQQDAIEGVEGCEWKAADPKSG